MSRRKPSLDELARKDSLTSGEAARLLGFSMSTLIRLADEGAIPFVSVPAARAEVGAGRHRHFWKRDLVAYQLSQSNALGPLAPYAPEYKS